MAEKATCHFKTQINNCQGLGVPHTLSKYSLDGVAQPHQRLPVWQRAKARDVLELTNECSNFWGKWAFIFALPKMSFKPNLCDLVLAESLPRRFDYVSEWLGWVCLLWKYVQHFFFFLRQQIILTLLRSKYPRTLVENLLLRRNPLPLLCTNVFKIPGQFQKQVSFKDVMMEEFSKS